MSAKTDKFLSEIKKGAMQLWDKFGILPSVAGGQGALESAWGTSGLATKYNNLFGIKGSYQGNSAMMNTWEVYGGQRYDIKDNFRAYPNWATSILDYGVFLTVNKRYEKAIGMTNYKNQIRAIHRAGYATDPKYSDKVINIIQTYRLDKWDKEVLQNVNEQPKQTGKVHTVKKGETLTSIARNFGTTVNALADLNNIKNKDLIRTGQKLKISGGTNSNTKNYKIQSGDVLGRIAQKHNTTVSNLMKLNPSITNADKIIAGKTIKVPK